MLDQQGSSDGAAGEHSLDVVGEGRTHGRVYEALMAVQLLAGQPATVALGPPAYQIPPGVLSVAVTERIGMGSAAMRVCGSRWGTCRHDGLASGNRAGLRV